MNPKQKRARLCRLYAADPRCIWCGRCTTLERRPLGRIGQLGPMLRSATLEHMVPQSVRPQGTPHDLELACLRCNSARGDRSAAEWRLNIADRYYDNCPIGVAPSNPLAAAGYLKAMETFDSVEYFSWLAALPIDSLFPTAFALLG